MNTTFAPFAVDLYKPSHADMYHEKSEMIFSNMTPRSSKYFKGNSLRDIKGVTVVGVERAVVFVKELWDTFFQMNKETAIKKYSKTMKRVVGQPVNADRLADLWDLGHLPITILSQKEGVMSPIGVAVYTIHNTDPKFFWLTNYLETLLSAETWKCLTIASIAREYYNIGKYYARHTCDNDFHLPYQFHDFSMRGMSCLEDAAKNGIGHLVYFEGSDNLPAIQTVEDYYDAEVGASVPATEHSVATSNITESVERKLKNQIGQSHGMSLDDARYYAELEFIEKYVTKIVTTGIRSYVLDSYDFWRMISSGLFALKDVISGLDGKLVVRPDSGTSPEEVICGQEVIELDFIPTFDINNNADDTTLNWVAEKVYYFLPNIEEYEALDVEHVLVRDSHNNFYKATVEFYNEYDNTVHFNVTKLEPHELTVEEKGAVQVLWETFGGSVNTKGYKVLADCIGLIYGDSITIERAEKIFKRLQDKGFASSNVVLGIGSYTYNFMTRDTLGFAVKATGTVIDGKPIKVSKDPKTDPGKKSANGFLKVVNKTGYGLMQVDNLESIEQVFDKDNTLKPLMVNGKIVRKTNFNEIRETAKSY